MNNDDLRERDQIRKMLRRKPVDLDAPVKPTTPELMQQLAAGISTEYTDGSDSRVNQTRSLFEDGKDKR